MNTDNIRNQISAALSSASKADFTATATDLLAVLGYRSGRTLELSGGADDFFQAFPAVTHNANTELVFREQVNSVRIIFQVTSEEIAGSDQSMLEFAHANPFDKGRQQSFIFFAVELADSSYARGYYAGFTREINKRMNQPSVVLFKTADNLLTFAFIHRRKHNRDPGRDVLGQVSLVREIHPADPHRAHLDILAELSLAKCIDWIKTHNKTPNFDSLLAAWLDKLDTEQLNRRFYRELFDWFNRAVTEARFPSDETRTLSAEEHVIRLITRLLFIWFIKEKGLIASELFIEAKIVELLKNYCQETGDSYYRAVLQNLFFATLNTEIDKRGFSKAQNTTHRNFSLYRYKQEMGDPDALLALFGKTPFINGGLFDCLDSEESTTHGGWRIDCFSDVHYKKLSIPDRLFFDNNGLFPLLNRYRFTVEENTPVEQEVALDPELLGKVFENLLAAYNPETKDTVRKRTGSYYTPREVVDYMVNEALVATLAERVHPSDDDMEFWRDRLHYLLDYADAFNDADELFEASEKKGIVQAIAAIKILDPAVGSGAFPMGALHKLTLALQRLDPNNQLWVKLQKERAKTRADMAFENRDQQERDTELLEISETFERYSGNFGRKLYLIQNSIFGVDIQPVACQIAKLRFFISLAIEQEPKRDVDNFGIKPLPNLETRFVAADTLTATKEKPRQDDWILSQIETLKTKLSGNREKHFHATTRQKKLACRHEDRNLRSELSEALHSAGLPGNDANKIASWDPYDQNASAEWFDAEYMFGIDEGFDVVIGNPPYIQLQRNGGMLRRLYQNAEFEVFTSTGDIYCLFYEKGIDLLKQNGNLCLITSNKWMRANYGEKLRRFLAQKTNPVRLLDFGGFQVFESATVDTNILLTRKARGNGRLLATKFQSDFSKGHIIGKYAEDNAAPINVTSNTWIIGSSSEVTLKEKIEHIGTPLKDWDISIYRGILTGYNSAFIIDNETKDALVRADPKSAEILKPVLRGRDIKRYQAQWAGLWLIDSHNGYAEVPPVNIGDYPAVKSHLDKYYPELQKRQDKGVTPYNLRNCAYHAEFEREKIVYSDISTSPTFALLKKGMYFNNTAYMISSNDKCILAILNSKIAGYYIPLVATDLGASAKRYFKQFVEKLPIPPLENKVVVSEILSLVGELLQKIPDTDSAELEKKLDKLVYQLYELSDEEIRTIESV